VDPKRESINYLYFGGLFAVLVCLVAASIFTKENLQGSQLFFFLYALGQVVLETALFIFLGLLVRRYLGAFCFALFIGATFFALFVHILDFMMDRILDLSAWESIHIFVLEENWENFLYLLDASGIPLWAWFVFFACFGSIPFLGFFLYRLTEQIARKKALSLHPRLFLQAFICIPCALFVWDFSASQIIPPDTYTAFVKSLPWKFTLLPPENVLLSLSGSVKQPPSEEAIAAEIEQSPITLAEKPNIYLFVVESLREDCITADIAPHLHAFKQANAHFDLALSGANATGISWFSIFHSQFPYCWKQAQKQCKRGSPALQLLKKWGYQIRLYSSAQLGFYGMEQLLFGNQKQLLDSNQTFHHAPPLCAADSDAAALSKLQKDLAENPSLQQGQVFLIFWDCTHFDYSWPKNWAPKFTPFASNFAYFNLFHSQNALSQIKNRYLNAIHYMDSLFGRFLDQLPNREEAIVIFTGDHGEEFFDHGHLFHNSHLTHEQIHIPLYLKLGKQTRPLVSWPVVSQWDIFPTLIDSLSGTTVSFLEGNSLFQPKWPYAIAARFNAGLSPYEFAIHNGKHKMIAQFLNRDNIFASKQLHILSLRCYPDLRLHEPITEEWIQREFGPALKRMLNSK
jgi:glucan phosphoethanolaminetransferase (alkaline phosphatase superfamily)